ncbi:hypothetical protein GGTG_04177 [Gaeumannomyces tritici R3-111a-1]|uniref:Uncharacterized protein n=1 Tax=Gaeumannomyces tritici (strain R3-111a-1) TaxID=644352 RepID=J3NSD1_GAET3|nr:hypothetical protein GGTG_04177 [Gaeumannomyces tritici R3-111a-1]EJT79088.1 hypothetical protein GGTG_04177 [Gaeumannomyces tritici R3-111a-1]
MGKSITHSTAAAPHADIPFSCILSATELAEVEAAGCPTQGPTVARDSHPQASAPVSAGVMTAAACRRTAFTGHQTFSYHPPAQVFLCFSGSQAVTKTRRSLAVRHYANQRERDASILPLL